MIYFLYFGKIQLQQQQLTGIMINTVINTI